MSSISDTDTINLVFGVNVNITVPASPEYLTTYVLTEQNDWFEDEIKFIRNILRPGMKVIDVGANYGVYTLTMASLVGSSGKVMSFEPTRFTYECLKKSIENNNYTNVELLCCGLSNKKGEAKLFTNHNSELNSITPEKTGDGSYEIISLDTLDNYIKKYNWNEIDFIKLDAEGEENNIVEAASEALNAMSPLIMFELKHGSIVNHELINTVIGKGYGCYRLVPGLNILIPFNKSEPFDGYILNLFCCKEDRVQQLESSGYLVREWDAGQVAITGSIEEYIKTLPCKKILDTYRYKNDKHTWGRYYDALDAYAYALNKSTKYIDRVSALMKAYNILEELVSEGNSKIECLVTYARIAFEVGERTRGLSILKKLIAIFSEGMNIEINDILLPATVHYDSISPDHKIKEWLFSSILEQYITKHAFSTYFTGPSMLEYLEKIQILGFMRHEMRKRLILVKSCFA